MHILAAVAKYKADKEGINCEMLKGNGVDANTNLQGNDRVGLSVNLIFDG